MAVAKRNGSDVQESSSEQSTAAGGRWRMLKRRVPLLSVLLLLLVFGGFAYASRNSGGTYSLPAGNPVVTGTTITSLWANTTLNDLKTEITNSLDRQGRGGMLAPLQIVSGTSALPGLTASAEPSSGLYRIGAGDWGFSLLTSQVMRWTSALVSTQVPLTVTGRTTTTDLTVSGTSDRLTVAATAAGFYGISSTGNGTGVGVAGIGGATNAIGVNGAGGGTTGIGVRGVGAAGGVSVGVVALGGGSGGDALQATAQTGSYNGVVALGSGSGSGIQGTGGATSGKGIYGLGGAPNGVGIYGVSQGSGSGVYGASGASGGAGLEGANAVPATGAVRQDGIRTSSGDINLNGTANATSSTAMLNRLAPNNIVKAWATVTLNAAGNAVTIVDGFNVSGAALSTRNQYDSVAHGLDTIDITFAQGMANANYAVHVDGIVGKCRPIVSSGTTTSGQVSIAFEGTGYNTGCSQTPDFTFYTRNWTQSRVTVVVVGAQ